MRDIDTHHPAIAVLRVVGDIADPVDDNIDLLVELKDGRRFSFTVFTLSNLERLLQGRLSFVTPGLLIVRRLTDESLIDAVGDAIEQGIEGFGIAQR